MFRNFTFKNIACLKQKSVKNTNFTRFFRHFSNSFIKPAQNFTPPGVPKLEGRKSIGTHDGKFHTDEVLGCYMLRYHTQEFKNAGKIN